MFRRIEPFVQARKYMRAVTSELPKRNGWTIAEHVGDRTPDKTQRLLNRAVWDEAEAMAQVRRFAVSGLEEAARKAGRRRGKLVIGALDETGQQKKGEATAGVKRQHLGCAGRVENGINTVHLSYVREGTGHALIGFRQWIPGEHITDPMRSLRMGLPPDLKFRTKGQLAIDICTTAATDGIRPDFYCGDEVYGNCTELRTHFEADQQAYVLRVQKNFRITLPNGTALSCDQAVKTLLQGMKQAALAPQTHQTRPQHRKHPGQLANGGCRTSVRHRQPLAQMPAIHSPAALNPSERTVRIPRVCVRIVLNAYFLVVAPGLAAGIRPAHS